MKVEPVLHRLSISALCMHGRDKQNGVVCVLEDETQLIPN